MTDRKTAFAGVPVGLDAVLRMKERRSLEQRRLIGKFGAPLISFSVVMPGAVKRNLVSSTLFENGRKAIAKTLERSRVPVLFRENIRDPAGDTALWAVEGDVRKIKLLCASLEDGLEWGRLLDIDTIDENGAPVARKDVAKAERGCLVCGKRGPSCARSRTHSLENVLDEVWRIARCMS